MHAVVSDQKLTVPSSEFLASMHAEQIKVFRDFDSQKFRFLALNWHRRARKTTLAINLLIREAWAHPKSVYVYIAPTYKQAKNIVWNDPNMLFKWVLPEIIEKKSEQELYIVLKNGSRIVLKGADDPGSLRGIDCRGIVFDEWAEFGHPEVWPEIFRPIIAQDHARWAIFVFTPRGQNHAFEMWERAERADDWYRSSLIPNPIFGGQSNLLPAEELERARLDMPESMFDQEFGCSFITDEQRTLITSKMIDDLKGFKPLVPHTKKLISVDPAFGGDECVAYFFVNTEVVDELILNTRDELKVFSQLSLFAHKHNVQDFIVDSLGIGLSVVAHLEKMGFRVNRFNASERAGDDSRFANRKAEAWWYVYEQIRHGRIEYPRCTELRRQLSGVKYLPEGRRGRVALELKGKTRKSIGRSPDRADAYVMGIWGLQNIAASNKKDSYALDDDSASNYVFNAATC